MFGRLIYKMISVKTVDNIFILITVFIFVKPTRSIVQYSQFKGLLTNSLHKYYTIRFPRIIKSTI